MSFKRTWSWILVASGWLGLAIPVSAQNHPFGSHPISYAVGSIVPNHVTQAARDQAARDFYDAWKERFVSLACGPGRYVVLASVSPSNLTVSEAHGYGMILTALMAGHDPDARAIFDGMYAYFREHPTLDHENLMAWNQSKACADVEGGDSASDGDLDIAYALLLADKQWGSCGPIDYLAEALSVLGDIKDGELDTSAQYVKLGDWVVPGDTMYYPATRTSDFMPDHYRSYKAATGDTAWDGLRTKTYQIVNSLQTNYSPTTGLLPDFVVNPLTTPMPAPPNFLENTTDGAYGYNACRDPWRLGTDFLVSGEPLAQAAVQSINTWIRSATGNDPLSIRSGYELDGTGSPGTDYLSMAFVAPLGVGAMVHSSNQTWLNSLWDTIVARPLEAEGYYENTLKLLSLIVMSGNWWAPHLVAGGCVSYGNSVCTDGGYMSGLRLKLSGIGRGPEAQGLKIRGFVLFPAGSPLTSFAGGAQLLIEDMGSGAASVYELTTSTNPIPPSTTMGCDPVKDAWRVTTTSTSYKNVSGSLDPPTCSAGSAFGLRKLQFRSSNTTDLRFEVLAKKTSIAAPVGPLRVSVVFGDSAADGSSGKCAVSSSLPCVVRGSSVLCQ